MRSVKMLLIALFILIAMPLSAHALSCPNKPSNAATLATIHFNTNDGEGQMWDLYPGAGTITTVSGSEGSVSASILPPGASVGGQQVIWPKPGNQQPLNNMYVCFRWKINSQFVGLVTNNKLIFVAAQDWTYGRQGFNAVLSVPRRAEYPPFPGSSLQMIWNHNSGNLDNSHACAFDLGLGCFPNINDTPILQDTWYTVELYTIASSTTTSRNGTVKWWINNVPQGSYTNLNVGDGIVNEFQINHTWDGSGAVQCYNPSTAPLGRDCTNPQIHYFDELLVASVGGLAPPPVSPPPPPPSSLWGNEPAGSQVVGECAFPLSNCQGFYDAYSLPTSTDVSEPVSPPNVGDMFLRYIGPCPGTISTFQQCAVGGGQFGYVRNAQQREMYVGMMFKVDANYGCSAVGTSKTIFMRANDITFGGPRTNGVFLIDGCGSTKRFIFGHNTGAQPGVGELDNSHACPNQLGLICYPNVGSGAFERGQWVKFEACIRPSTSWTSRDAIVKWWVNGVLAGNYSNLNYGQAIINQFDATPTWDGYGNGQGFQQDTHQYYGHIRISSPPSGGCASTSGGGSTTPPPPPSTPPPPPPSPTPTGNPGTVADLAVTPQSTTTAKMTFTAVTDGAGNPAKYDNRMNLAPISWGSAPSISVGNCASPFAPSNLIGQQIECLITGLAAGASYQAQNVAFRGTMNAGAIYGGLSNVASFTMPSSNEPTITTLAPSSGVAGIPVTISGTNFSPTIANNTVKFNGQAATVTAASATSITATVPDGATTGRVSVQTSEGIVFSQQNFTVGTADNGCGCS